MFETPSTRETTHLEREPRAIRASSETKWSFDAIMGASPAIVRAKALLRRVARSHSGTVLITGETGTGKDLAAKLIHHNSERAAMPYTNITCSALPEQLLEAELFGHERGAFTDAKVRRRGLLEEADGGTVFLDEIGEMPLAAQAKLLRFLEERVVRRVGSTKDLHLDVRVVAATNRNLEEEVKTGHFREDLYYRIAVLKVAMPPLREREDDVLLLAKHFAHRFSQESGKTITHFKDEAMEELRIRPWPGNVRELRNVIEGAVLLADGPALSIADAQRQTASPPDANSIFRLPVEGVNLDYLERQLVVQALQRTGGNQTRAGRLLGLNRDQVRYRIEKFELQDLLSELSASASSQAPSPRLQAIHDESAPCEVSAYHK